MTKVGGHVKAHSILLGQTEFLRHIIIKKPEDDRNEKKKWTSKNNKKKSQKPPSALPIAFRTLPTLTTQKYVYLNLCKTAWMWNWLIFTHCCIIAFTFSSSDLTYRTIADKHAVKKKPKKKKLKFTEKILFSCSNLIDWFQIILYSPICALSASICRERESYYRQIDPLKYCMKHTSGERATEKDLVRTRVKKKFIAFSTSYPPQPSLRWKVWTSTHLTIILTQKPVSQDSAVDSGRSYICNISFTTTFFTYLDLFQLITHVIRQHR